MLGSINHPTPLATFFLLLLLNAAVVQADDLDPQQVDFFEKKIRPVLVEHCYACHSSQAKVIRGGLVLDTRAGCRQGGDSGAAVIPEKPEESLLLQALHYESFEMPPQGKLPETVISDFENWIRMGAVDPRDGPARQPETRVDLSSAAEFWAFQAPTASSPPAVKNTPWAETEIDRYILAKLESRGLEPVRDADRPALLRRASFALVGLPPTREQIETFVRDESPLPVAFAKTVDRMLASQHFGQRWGRHWLDVARFAESSGGGRSLMFKDAWRYRDYVIDAYNHDKPFNQMIVEQIAGDLLPFQSPAQRDEHLIATGFLALGPTNYEQQDKELLRAEVIDEQIDTVGRAFLGLTLGCARCHDHKFDPVSTREYYALAGIFGSTQTLVHSNVSKYLEQSLSPSLADLQAIKQHQLRVQELEIKLKGAQAEQKDLRRDAHTTDDPSVVQQQEMLTAQIKAWTKQLNQLKKGSPKVKAVAMSVKDVAHPADGRIHIRGNVHNLGPTVPRGFIRVASSSDQAPLRIANGQSGRMELARWIARPDNPLTARVYVNRVWRHLFGFGLVATPDNHGNQGSRPTHPELLDHLALRFIADGWSTKRLIRYIMLSHTYRLSTRFDHRAHTVDPANQLLWRHPRRRLDAEVIRDSILSVSGQLDETAGGLTIRKLSEYDLGYQFNTTRRSVYVPAFRNSVLELFKVFDAANPNLVVGHRHTSVLPTQALYLMNSPFVIEQSRYAARRLLRDTETDDSNRVVHLYLQVLGREPTDRERETVLAYLREFQADQPQIDDSLEAWTSICHALIASLDFRYVD